MVQKYDRFAIQEPETETNLAVSVAAGIGSGLIKSTFRFSFSCCRVI